MAFPIGMIMGGIGTAGSLLDAFGSNKRNKRHFDRAQQQHFAAQGAQQTGFAHARSGMQQGLGTLQQGFQQAQNALSGVGVEAYQQNQDFAKMAMGGARAGAVNRGLFGSSVGRGMEAQSQYQAMRQTGSIANRIAQARASLFAQQGQAMAGQQNLIAQTHMQQGQAGMQNAQQFGRMTPPLEQNPWGHLGSFGGLLQDYLDKK